MGLNYFSSSPVVLPPQNSNHHLTTPQHEAEFQQKHSIFARRCISKQPPPSSLNHFSHISSAAAGRKRSRDDIGDELECEREASSRAVVADHMQVPSEGVADASPLETMFPGQSATAITQDFRSGIWEQDKDSTQNGVVNQVTRPRLVARKSQRRVDGETHASFHEQIDPIVMKLGIGWKRITDTSHAGSERFIRNQFQKNDARILLHHEGLQIFVVRVEPESAKGYWHQWWLFREDLKSCRFLCNEDHDLFRRLDHKRQDERGNWQPDILVEGPEYFALDTPQSPINALSPANGVANASNVEAMLSLEAQLLKPLPQVQLSQPPKHQQSLSGQQPVLPVQPLVLQPATNVPVSEDVEMEGMA